MEPKKKSISVAGKELTFETGRIARQAGGAVLLTMGETMVLGTACAAKEGMGGDFLPMRVDYVEKFSSAGKTLGGFIKREGRPTEREILVARLIDRPLRPMFEDGYTNELQIISKVLSYDGVNGPEPLAICAASAALVISEVPLIKPVAAVRVGHINGELVINPTVQEMENTQLDLMIAGTEDAVLMIEGYANFFTEEQILEAIEEGSKAIKTICEALSDWQKIVGKEKNRSTIAPLPEGLFEKVEGLVKEDLLKAVRIADKDERGSALDAIGTKVTEHFFPEEGEKEFGEIDVKKAQKKVTSHYMRQMILKESKRCDGRRLNEIRPIHIDMDLLPRTHGSTLFTRGETQAIAVCTLGSESMGQRFESLNEADGLRRFYLQYFFPPYSVGEVGRMGPPARREVGHGKLAERALAATIPSKEDFPYTIRLESNITESNGSSSMASVCGGCLAMMQAGVPIRRPVAGIAMGLILEGESYSILSDILGIEDALGDMDFKITGDEKGITAFQLDIKVEGITPKIMGVALAQAKEGRIHILNKMLEACPKTQDELSVHAPKIEMIPVHPSKIGTVIGPGGKQIRAIQEFGVSVDIDDAGLVSITSNSKESIEKAKQVILDLVSEVEEGKTYTGKVTGIKDFGVFVKIFSSEGLLHISEISQERLKTVEGLFNIGDEVTVKVMEINKRGQIRLSRKALLK
ncbi:MAG: polyribonucleotide nucleotidyltransferase [Candidatus Algichlamydia australiensis]|nr:polyribonucleotide nucleotidyltransferase [Chlamydiales bacterium]